MAVGKGKLNYQPDPFQLEAIACLEKGVRIVAPAGSGKTETLARRVAASIESGSDPRRILILTFDTNARKSLEGFVKQSVPLRRAPRIRTLNQIGKDILKEYFPSEDSVILADKSDEIRAMRSLFQSYAIDLPVLEWDGVQRKILEVFEALKNQGFQPGSVADLDTRARWLRREYLRLPDVEESATLDDFWSTPTGTIATDAYAGQIQRILELYAEHDRYCRESGFMSFTDQKSRAFFALQRNHDIRDVIRASYDEIIVDECQDINRLDACLIWAVVGENTTLVLAGDDDQTLYEFRNAHSLYLRDPERFFTDRTFTTIHLNINYRSPEAILKAANAMIGHNVERIEKSPKSGVRQKGDVRVLAAESTTDEARQILQRLREILDQRGPTGAPYSFGDIVFLCHDDATRKWVEGLLRSARIPVFNDDRRRGSLVNEGVEVLTFRKAKGRQWPVVFLPNSSDRVLPDDQSVREGQLESVRRLYYVAMTRASHMLVVSHVRAGESDVIHRTMSGEVVSTNGASRFLFEAGLVGGGEPSSLEVAPDTVEARSLEPPVVSPERVESVITTPEPVVATSPEPKVQVIVQPVPDTAPDASVAPVKRKRATKPWELRQVERDRLEKAFQRWEEKDHLFAVTDAWWVIESVLKRIITMPPGEKDASPYKRIQRGSEIGIISPHWASRLHAWRKLRNELHPPDATNLSEEEFERMVSFDEKKVRVGWELVSRASECLAYLAEHVAPKQVDLEIHDEYIAKLTGLVDRIASGQPLPRTGRPLKAIRFDPDREALEMIPFQFLMIMRDVRFYIPEEFRWSAAPIIGKFLVDTLGGVPAAIRPRGAHGTRNATKADEDRVYLQLVRLLENEARDDNHRVALQIALDDAIKVGNGNFHAGLKLNPRRLG